MTMALIHLCVVVSCFLTTLANGQQAQGSLERRQLGNGPIEHRPLPDCAETCFQDLMRNTSCARQDFTCLCYHGLVSNEMRYCFEKRCYPQVLDYLRALNTTTSDCGREDREPTPLVKTVSISMGMLALVCVMLRLLERSDKTHKLRRRFDDWIMVFNGLLVLGFTVIGVELPQHGMGRDSYTLPFETLEYLMKLLITHEVLYMAIIMLTKLSILFVYFRIFPLRVMPRLRIAIPVTMGVVIASGLAMGMSIVFQCIPVHYFWDRLRDARGGRCINITAWGWANGAINVALDTALIALPLPELIKLRLYWKKKLRVCLMFTIGSLVILISIPRLAFMEYFVLSNNPTHQIPFISFFSALEAYIGVICACLPRIYILFSHLFGRLGILPDPDSSQLSHPASHQLVQQSLPYIHPHVHNIDPESCPDNLELAHGAACGPDSPGLSSAETATEDPKTAEMYESVGRLARQSGWVSGGEDVSRTWASKPPRLRRRASI